MATSSGVVDIQSLGENPARFLLASGGGATCVTYLLEGVVKVLFVWRRIGMKILLVCSTSVVGVCRCQYPS
jgi:hypothetical protein